MKKLKEILIESGEDRNRTKQITREEALNIFKTKCDTSNIEPKLYRGIKSANMDYGLVKPSKTKRALSSSIAGYHALIMDSTWKGWPKRTNSIICSSSMLTAGTYARSGNVYVVLPFKNAKIAVAPSRDLWSSFAASGIDRIWKWTYDLSYLLKATKVGSNLVKVDEDKAEAPLDSYISFISYLNRVLNMDNFQMAFSDMSLVTKRLSVFWRHAVHQIIDDPNFNLQHELEYAFAPTRNYFKLVSNTNNIPHDRECWTDSDCLLIEYSIYMDKFYNELKQ